MISRPNLRPLTGILTLLLFAWACGDQTPVPTAPDVRAQYARGGHGGGGGSPVVDSVNPDEGEQGQTLDIVVTGQDFQSGDEVFLGIDGSPVAEIVTNGTTFVGSETLAANITIAPETDIGDYDVLVMGMRGRKGIGTALFRVKLGQHQNAFVTDLGTIEGRSVAVDINRVGVAVGRATASDGWHIVSWDIPNGGALRDHGTGWAAAIDGLGHVAGYDGGAGTQTAMVLDLSSGAVTHFAPLPGHATSQALDVNDAGLVAGWSQTTYPSGPIVGVVWDLATGTATELAGLGGPNPPRPFAINSQGALVGIADGPSTSGARAVIWMEPDAAPIDLTDGGDWAWPYGVSDPDANGVVYVAGQWGIGNAYYSCVWTVNPDGFFSRENLASTSYAFDVNSRGDVVGWIGETSSRAYMWRNLGGTWETVELGSLVGRGASAAEGINEAGLIVGRSHYTTKGANKSIEHAVYWQFP